MLLAMFFPTLALLGRPIHVVLSRLSSPVGFPKVASRRLRQSGT